MKVCLFILCLGLSRCSIPSLESPDCAAARDGVKQFYSFHFGNDMHPSKENLKARQKYLTPELFRSLDAATETPTDYFTESDVPPKTFKIAKCTLNGSDNANVEVQLYWRDDTHTEQKEVQVKAVKNGDTWLVDNVSK